MANVVVVGSQWGDEGKGKLVDVLAGRADVVARFNGGANAGHSLVVDGKTYAFHLLPCGMLRADCENVIGNGVVVHLPTLFEELRQLDDGTDASLERLVVSSRAHVLLDAHRVIDGMIEDEKRGRSTGSLGTTKRGVGPAYASKMNRNGLRFCDLVGPDDVLVERLRLVVRQGGCFVHPSARLAERGLEGVHDHQFHDSDAQRARQRRRRSLPRSGLY